jgi:chromosome segregation ATPase
MFPRQKAGQCAIFIVEAQRTLATERLQQIRREIARLPPVRPNSFPDAAKSFDAAFQRFQRTADQLIGLENDIGAIDQQMQSIKKMIEDSDAIDAEQFAKIKENMARKQTLEEAIKDIKARRKVGFNRLDEIRESLRLNARKSNRLAEVKVRADRLGKDLDDLGKKNSQMARSLFPCCPSRSKPTSPAWQ